MLLLNFYQIHFYFEALMHVTAKATQLRIISQLHIITDLGRVVFGIILSRFQFPPICFHRQISFDKLLLFLPCFHLII